MSAVSVRRSLCLQSFNLTSLPLIIISVRYMRILSGSIFDIPQKLFNINWIVCSSYRLFIGCLIASFIGLSFVSILMVNKSHHVIVYCVQFKDAFVVHQFLFWIVLHIRQCRCYGASPCFFLYLYICI